MASTLRAFVAAPAVALALLLAVAAPRPAAAETIRLVSANGFPPMMYEEGGAARGYAVDIARAILEDAGFAVAVEALPWPRAQDEVLRGDAVITGFSFSDDRVRRGFLYSIVAFKDPVVVVARADTPHSFARPEDLIGRTVGNARGTSYGPVYEELKPRLTIDEDGGDEQRLRKIEQGRVEFGLFSGGPIILTYARDHFGIDPADFRVFEEPLVEDDIYLAVGNHMPNAERIIERINQSIRKLTADGTIQRLLAGEGAPAG